MSTITRDTIDLLKSKMRGPIILPDDPEYDQARSIWNAMVDKRPGAIARCTGVADVMHAVRVANDLGLLVSVRSGGHNIAGSALCDDGLTIDLSGMKSVRIDPDARLAYVEAGATLGDFDHEAQAFGLATSLGINSTTGVAGLTLGGGFGWLTRKHGLAVDNLLAAEMVTADGERLRVNAEENSDLFWAIRGGGGNFGIVTQFVFRLHPVGPEVLSGLVVYPFEQAKSVLTRYREFVETIPDDLCIWAVLRKAPPLPFLPEAVHGREVVVFAFMHSGDMEEGRRLIEPVRHFGESYGEHIGPNPYAGWQQGFDPLLTPGARNYWKSHNFAELSDGAIDTVIEYTGTLPSPQCEIFIALLGGEANRVAADATAYAHRTVKFVMNVHGRWDEPDQDRECISWSRDFFEAAKRYAMGGVYVNFMTEEETDRIGAAYGSNYERLAQLKRRYDPGNLFHLNQNIKPETSSARGRTS
jgi:FAD/FMN-containing dehydrogenase